MQRKVFNTLMVFLLTLALTTPALAQGSGQPLAQKEVKSYIVVLEEQPIVSYEGGISGLAPTKIQGGEKVEPADASVRAYDNFLEAQHEESLEAAGVSVDAKIHDYTVALNGYSAILTEEQAETIRLQKNVHFVMEDQRRYPQTDSSPEFLGLTVRGGAYDSGYTGEGVVVGVIDTGIWPEHPSFADDGTYAAPPTGPLPCEFGNTAHNPNDAPFTCNNKLIGAYQMLDTYRALIGADPDEFDSARDDDGHGTHTASTAAGNAGVEASMYGLPVATISGIAPRAHVIAYKGLGNLGGFTSDLAAAIDQAVADGVDVINYSIGGGAGLPSADEIAFLFAADAGVFVATSAGNSGSGAATVGNPGTMPWITTVGASTQKRFYEGVITLGNGKKYTGASLTPELGWRRLVDAADFGNELCDPAVPFTGDVSGKIVLCLRGAVGRAEKSLSVFEAGGVGMILYNTNDVDNLFTDTHWVPSVHIDNTPGLKIKAYIASSRFPKAKIETREDHFGCDRFQFHNYGISGRGADWFERECGPRTSKWPHAPTMTIFSSRGPNPVAPDIIKPDITAPGLQILAGNSPFPDPGAVPGELFQGIAGTSMSSPHVAGVFALLKQAHPEWSAAMAKSALMTTAYQKVLDNDRVSQADPFDMGSGHIRPGGRWTKGSINEPGLVYDAGLFEYAAFTCGMNWGVFSPGSCAFLESLGIPSEPYNLNYPSIGVSSLAGTQTVVRTVTSVASGPETFKAKVVAPPGYDVTVTPNSLTLNPGESATFEVTITNNGGGPVGEWRFGSLTWKAHRYSVYSPIAVQGALFDAPGEISGTGESGSASFDVQFGYTGAYAAGAHGLVPATVTNATVLQDPDQEFDPNDGFSNAHTFNLSGVAFFRLAMPPEATEADADLDVYVFDPNGDLVASSTAGGTDELVDILLPADGTWTVYVHGWQTVGPDSTYDMYSWAVPLASGGNLVIDSAPTSATIGNVETINVSWTGATAGEWHLGAVSHTGDAGLMGLTLVNVDNR
ncbi:MAG: S8 family serine peptidase [Anaerolineales bacterium]|nr:S8 family serine peptidase [Anaerolineales bacterium]